jgi:transcriptional regulator with PAS, ATPase and Fis domain
MFAKTVTKARLLAKQAFTSALASDTLVKQKQKLDAKKAMLAQEHRRLTNTITETMLETATAIAKLHHADKFDTALDAIVTSTRNHQGVIFMNYRGEIIFTNAFTQRLLGLEGCDIVGKTVESFIIGTRQHEHVIADYSAKIINFLNTCPDESTIPDELLNCKMINDAFVGPVYASFADCSCKRKHCTNAFTFEVTLLDTHPSVLEDVTYICKISPYTSS